MIPITEAPAPRAPGSKRNVTLVPGTLPAQQMPVLPFKEPDPKRAPEASGSQPATIEPDGDPWATFTAREVPPTHTPVLPFKAAAPTPFPPVDAGGARRAASASKEDAGTLDGGFIHPTTTALPFKTASPPETRHQVSMPPPQLTPAQSFPQEELEIEAGSRSPLVTGAPSIQPFLAPLPPLASGPSKDVGEAAPERVEPAKARLSLQQYARIKTELWGAHASLSEVLERHGIDEVEWRIHERRQADALADEGRGGRCDLALALMAAFEASQAEASDAGLGLS
jgi:hypothetical protein